MQDFYAPFSNVYALASVQYPGRCPLKKFIRIDIIAIRQITAVSHIFFNCFQRLRKAAQLLETTGLPVLQVAADVGYGSVSQFGQAFRRQYGVSPAQYRRING